MNIQRALRVLKRAGCVVLVVAGSAAKVQGALAFERPDAHGAVNRSVLLLDRVGAAYDAETRHRDWARNLEAAGASAILRGVDSAATRSVERPMERRVDAAASPQRASNEIGAWPVVAWRFDSRDRHRAAAGRLAALRSRRQVLVNDRRALGLRRRCRTVALRRKSRRAGRALRRVARRRRRRASDRPQLAPHSDSAAQNRPALRPADAHHRCSRQGGAP